MPNSAWEMIEDENHEMDFKESEEPNIPAAPY